MRTPVALSLIALLSLPSAALAVPDPVLSTAILNAPDFPCHFKFRVDSPAAFDELNVTVSLVNAAGVPEVAWPVTCTLLPIAGTLAFCTCCPNPQVVATNGLGIVVFTFKKIGGRGALGVSVGVGPWAFPVMPIAFTSPDMNGSCEAAPAGATTLVDLGIFAGGLPPAPFDVNCDFNCSGVVDVVDLGVWAGGLNKGCGPPCP